LEHTSFKPLVSSFWTQWIVVSPIFIWEKKLIWLKKDIKLWGKSTFEAPQNNFFLLQANLGEVALKLEYSLVSSSLLKEEEL